jgi:hypothetical protein
MREVLQKVLEQEMTDTFGLGKEKEVRGGWIIAPGITAEV